MQPSRVFDERPASLFVIRLVARLSQRLTGRELPPALVAEARTRAVHWADAEFAVRATATYVTCDWPFDVREAMRRAQSLIDDGPTVVLLGDIIHQAARARWEEYIEQAEEDLYWRTSR